MSTNSGGRPRRHRFLRASALWLVGWLVLEGSLGVARAALQFDVFLGYDEISREASWVPIVCEVFNDGPPFQAVFELTSPYGASQMQRMRLDLPTNTRKRFVIPVFCRGFETWSARLLDERGRVRDEKPVIRPRKSLSRQAGLLGGMPRAFSGLPVLPKSTSNRQGWNMQSEVAHLQPAQFPDNPIALEGLDALYLNSSKALDLNVNQTFAITAWVQAGGHLIVAVDQITDVNATPWLRSLVPCDLTGSSSVVLHGEIEDWVRGTTAETRAENLPSAPVPYPGARSGGGQNDPALAKRYGMATAPGPAGRGSVVVGRGNVVVPPPSPVPGATDNPYAKVTRDPALAGAELAVAVGSLRSATPLLSVGGVPLVVSRNWGRGKVTVLLFNPEREPFRSWENRTWFWAKLTGITPREGPGQVYGGSSIDGLFGAMLDSKQVRKLPVGWLLVLLIAYLGIIGPVDQYVLKRLNRQMLTWITFPTYVVLFSGLIYFIGYKLRAGVSEWNEISLVDVLPRADKAELRGRTYVSIYSPANVRYPLASDQPFAGLRSEHGGSQQGTQAEIDQLAKGFRALVLVPVWTSQLYVHDWWESSDIPVSAQITKKDGNWRVAITNHLSRELTALRLVVEGRVHDLGRLATGQSTNLVLAAGQGVLLRDYFDANCGQQISSAMAARRQAFGGGQKINLDDFARYASAACFYSQIPDTTTQPQFGSSGRLFGPSGLDLSSLVQRGDAMLLAWDAGHALQRPLNQFTPLRCHRDTLLRLSVPVANATLAAESPTDR